MEGGYDHLRASGGNLTRIPILVLRAHLIFEAGSMTLLSLNSSSLENFLLQKLSRVINKPRFVSFFRAAPKFRHATPPRQAR